MQSAEVYATVRSAGDFGVVTGETSFDWPTALARKNKIVNGLVTGLSGLLKMRKVDLFEGYGRLEGPGKVTVEQDGTTEVLEGRNVILATGSVPTELPGLPFDGDRIVSSDHALDWSEQPARVGIIGGGIVGCEFASLLADVGSQVAVFEMLDQIIPGFEPDAAQELQKQLKRRKVRFFLGTGAAVENTETGLIIRGESGPSQSGIKVDVVLVAVGRRPVTADLGLDTVATQTDRGFVVADLSTMETAQPGVFAVGDIVAGTPGLAHGAFAEAISAITYIATGETRPVDYRALPNVVYTSPEVASVGTTSVAAGESNVTVESHDHSFLGVGRARIVGKNRGFVRVINEVDGPIVGATVVGPHAGEMIHELMYAVGWEALPEEAAAFIHAHPTLSEAVGETLLSMSGRSLH